MKEKREQYKYVSFVTSGILVKYELSIIFIFFI